MQKKPKLEHARCAECGAMLPAGLPKGLCAQCAFDGALGMSHAESNVFPPAAPTVAAESQPLPEDAAGFSPASFGDYDLLEEIARGGMGVVYKARQTKLDRIVAVKMILAGQLAGKEFVRRFRTEASAAALLLHPGIVAIHDVGVHEGRNYFSMDYVDGPNLSQLVGRQPLSPARAARYLEHIAEAIHYAHERGILHRDLKPSNVIVDTETDLPRVTDFGLAKRFNVPPSGDSAATESLTPGWDITITGQVLGSPNFMPPEQAGGKRGKMGRPSDVYALGGILYYLLTARAPFQADSLEHTISQVLNAEPVSPRLLNPSIPRDLETITLKCLEKEPSRRYQTAKELADELGRVLRHEPIQARPVSRLERAWRWCRRKPVIAALSATTALLFLAVTIGSPIAALRISRERTRAEQGELSSRRAAYAGAMDLANRSLDANSLGRARELLNRHRPGPGQLDLRGWEWRYLWQRARSAAVGTVCQSSNLIGSLAVSQDGNWVAIGDHHFGGLSIWNWRSRVEVVRLPVGEDAVHVAFSPREPLLACSGVTRFETSAAQSSVRLWDGNSQQFVAELALTGVCRALAFAEDGQTLVTVTFAPDNKIVLWNVADRKKRTSHAIPATANDEGRPFAIARDLSVAAHVVTGAMVRVIDLVSGATRWTCKAGNDVIESVAFSRDGKLLATGGGIMESQIRLWDVETGTELARLDGHWLWVSALLFLPDGKTLASASADQTVRLWDLTRLDNVPSPRTLLGHEHEVWRLALMPDNRTLVSGAKDGSVLLWDTSGDSHYSTHFTLRGPFRGWRFGTNEETIVTCDRQGRVSAWSGSNFTQETILFQLGPNILAHLFSLDGRWLAAGSSEGLVEVWNLHERTRVSRFKASTVEAIPQFFLAEGKRLVTRDPAESFYDEWNVATGEKTKQWRGLAGRSVSACAPDGKSCLLLSHGGMSLFRDMTSGRETHLRLDLQYGQDLAFSPDGKLFAAATDFGLAKVWETASRAEVGRIRSGLLGMHSVAFSPDGSRLAIGGNGAEAIKLWDLNSHEELLSLAASGPIFRSTAFSSSGNVLGSMNREGVLHLWRAPSWAEIETVEKNAKPTR